MKNIFPVAICFLILLFSVSFISKDKWQEKAERAGLTFGHSWWGWLQIK